MGDARRTTGGGPRPGLTPASGADSGGWRQLMLAFAGLLASLLVLQPVRGPESRRRR